MHGISNAERREHLGRWKRGDVDFSPAATVTEAHAVWSVGPGWVVAEGTITMPSDDYDIIVEIGDGGTGPVATSVTYRRSVDGPDLSGRRVRAVPMQWYVDRALALVTHRRADRGTTVAWKSTSPESVPAAVRAAIAGSGTRKRGRSETSPEELREVARVYASATAGEGYRALKAAYDRGSLRSFGASSTGPSALRKRVHLARHSIDPETDSPYLAPAG